MINLEELQHSKTLKTLMDRKSEAKNFICGRCGQEFGNWSRSGRRKYCLDCADEVKKDKDKGYK